MLARLFDKDQTDDPWSFVPIFHSELTREIMFQSRDERNLKKRNESSKQCEENQHASNLSLIILDEHKNLHSNIFDKIDDGSAVPGGMLHATHNLMFLSKILTPLDPRWLASLYRWPENCWAWTGRNAKHK
jgi:hypothetical protein